MKCNLARCSYVIILLADKATAHSQKCCEKLVEEGAIKTLLKIFGSATRSIPDQEVQKHVLSTLRNLARYPHLVEVLIDSPGSVETVVCEFVRFVSHILSNMICQKMNVCYNGLTANNLP